MKRIVSYIVLIVFALSLSTTIVVAQDTNSDERRASFGVIGTLGLNQHSGSFDALPDVPNCGSIFTNGFGLGPNLGVFYTIPFADKFSVSVRGLFVSEGGTFNADESIPLSIGGQEVSATDRHSLSVTLSRLALQPVAQYEIISRLSVYGGMQIGYLLAGSFNQLETLTSPSSGVFTENELRTRNPQSGSIPDASKIEAAFVIGAGYELPLNTSGTLHAIPQAYFTIGLTPTDQSVSWHTNTFAFGVAIEYTPAKPEPPPAVIPPPPPPVPPAPAAPPPVAVNIKAYGRHNDGTETGRLTIQVEELYAKNMSPLLPFVFFDSTSSDIPPRMKLLNADEASRFDANKVSSSNALITHTEMLNIIGHRLAASPSSTVVLTGIIRNPGQAVLVRQRAENVKRYFVNTWGISARRISVETQPSPVASNMDSDIIVEEHRVEIRSNDLALFDPLTTLDTIRSAEPPALRMYPSLVTPLPLTHWEIAARQQDKTLATFSGDDTLPKSVDWRFGAESMPKYPGNLDITVNVTDTLGRTATNSATIPVEQLTLGKKKTDPNAERMIEKYNLIVFDRGSADLTEHHKRFIEQIKADIKPTSKITVQGYTDRVGDAKLNQTLSEDRANAVAKALGVPQTQVIISGMGETQTLYSNILPEGRYFCRTVIITVDTPVERP